MNTLTLAKLDELEQLIVPNVVSQATINCNGATIKFKVPPEEIQALHHYLRQLVVMGNFVGYDIEPLDSPEPSPAFHHHRHCFDFHAANNLVQALCHQLLEVDAYPAVKQIVIAESMANELAVKYPISVGTLRAMFTVMEDEDYYPKASRYE